MNQIQKHYQIKKSIIGGMGLFAIKDFIKQEHISFIGDETIEVEDPFSLNHDLLSHAFPIDKKNNKFIYIISPPAIFLNHSCNPNIGIKNNKEFIALKKIKKGEEILIDYALCNIDGFRMVCNCKSKNCRKRLVPFEDLDYKTKHRYLPYCIDFIKNKYINKPKRDFRKKDYGFNLSIQNIT